MPVLIAPLNCGKVAPKKKTSKTLKTLLLTFKMFFAKIKHSRHEYEIE